MNCISANIFSDLFDIIYVHDIAIITSEENIRQAIVLLSGGIDSMACVHFYLNQGYRIEALFCDYGQPASVPELESAKKISQYYQIPLHVIQTTSINIPESGEICGRNALLVQQALCFGGYGVYKIILGIPDKYGITNIIRNLVQLRTKIVPLLQRRARTIIEK